MSKQRILLVDDDEADIILFSRTCRKRGLDVEIETARDGLEALELLRESAGQPDRRVIVTDLNMPRLGGHEFIEALRSDAALSTHVVFVLSTSALPQDVEACYRRHVAGYIVKDTHGERLNAGIDMLMRYFEAVTLA